MDIVHQFAVQVKLWYLQDLTLTVVNCPLYAKYRLKQLKYEIKIWGKTKKKKKKKKMGGKKKKKKKKKKK